MGAFVDFLLRRGAASAAGRERGFLSDDNDDDDDEEFLSDGGEEEDEQRENAPPPLSSPLAHAPRPGCGNRLLAELLHGDDVDAAHGAFWFLIFDEVLRWLSLRREWF